ncbi:MAG: 4-hydroxy-tetrahydrodipicolinate reductase [Oceanicaulis sp.]
MAELLKVCVAGVSGRLGRRIAAELAAREETALSGGMVSADSPHLGADLGEFTGAGWAGIPTKVALEDASAGAGVVIDVTAPKVTVAIAERLAKSRGPAFVTGTTGLDADQQAALHEAAKSIPVLQASNFSLGVAVLERLVAEAARALSAEQFDLEITETHHRKKADSPSGTAISLGQAAARGRDQVFEKVAAFERPRQGGSRRTGEIGFAASRGGGVVGEHAARFISDFEEVTIAHRAFDRGIFARGAVEAALWLAGKEPGFYTMQDLVKG